MEAGLFGTIHCWTALAALLRVAPEFCLRFLVQRGLNEWVVHYSNVHTTDSITLRLTPALQNAGAFTRRARNTDRFWSAARQRRCPRGRRLNPRRQNARLRRSLSHRSALKTSVVFLKQLELFCGQNRLIVAVFLTNRANNTSIYL
jgi:hypothetical protein